MAFDENFWREQLDYLYNNGYPDDQRNLRLLNQWIVKTPDGRIDKANTQYTVHTKLYEAFQRGEDVGQDINTSATTSSSGYGGGGGGGGGVSSTMARSKAPAIVDPALGNVPTMGEQMKHWTLKTLRFDRKPLGFGAITLKDKLLVMDVTAGSVAAAKGVRSQWHIVNINGKNDINWMKKHLKKSQGPFEITFTFPGHAGGAAPGAVARTKSTPNIAVAKGIKFVDPALGNVTSVTNMMDSWTTKELLFPTKPLGFGVVILKSFLVVQDVRPDSLAASLGVKLQWHVTKVSGETSVQAMMHLLHKGRPPFTIEFKYRGAGRGMSLASSATAEPGATVPSSEAPPPPGMPAPAARFETEQPGAAFSYNDSLSRAHTDPPGKLESSRLPSAFQADRKKNRWGGGGGGASANRGPPPSAAIAAAAASQPGAGGPGALPFRQESNDAKTSKKRCAECQNFRTGRPDEYGTFYCNQCWANYNNQLDDVVNSPQVAAPAQSAPAVPSIPAPGSGGGSRWGNKSGAASPAPKKKKWGAPPSSQAPGASGRGPPPSAAAAQQAISKNVSSPPFGAAPPRPGGGPASPRFGAAPPRPGGAASPRSSNKPAVPRSFAPNRAIGGGAASPPSSSRFGGGPPSIPGSMQKQASLKNSFGPPPSKAPPNPSAMRGKVPSIPSYAKSAPRGGAPPQPGGASSYGSPPSYGAPPGPPGGPPGPPGGAPPQPPGSGGGRWGQAPGGPPPPAPGGAGGTTSPKRGWGFGGFGKKRGANAHMAKNNNPNLPPVDKGRANLLNSIQKVKKKKLNHVETREPASPAELQSGRGGPPSSSSGGGLLGLDNAIANRRRMIMGSVASSVGDDDQDDDEWR